MPRRHERTARSSSRSSKRSDPPPDGDAPGMVAVGTVVAPHGLQGLLRVRAFQPPAPSLAPGRHVVLAGDGGSRAAVVRSAGAHGRGLVLVGLEGVADRSAAEALVGTRVLVHRTDLPPPAGDEFYYHDLVGCRVETTTGRALGTIA